jgi:hypothetical protein
MATYHFMQLASSKVASKTKTATANSFNLTWLTEPIKEKIYVYIVRHTYFSRKSSRKNSILLPKFCKTSVEI